MYDTIFVFAHSSFPTIPNSNSYHCVPVIGVDVTIPVAKEHSRAVINLGNVIEVALRTFWLIALFK